MPDFRPLRPAASSPAPPSHQNGPPPAANDTAVRQMRLKVLYSFDNENKTNCLARWPTAIDIRTAYLDESTQIGVIELKTCIQAIVAASPELVAKLGQDYTVYAYDYSEYETPLVGQGMLSWVLASSSTTPSAPAHQSRTMVTGRVCKNLLGLFSSSSQETLEVKLRLVPVPTSLQSEYIESMKRYRDISQVMPEGFDPQAWTNFLQANPNFLQLANQSRCQSPASGPGQINTFGIEHVQRLLSGNASTSGNTEPHRAVAQSHAYQNADAAAQIPRPSSAASSVQSGTAPKKRGRPPGSRTTTRGRGARSKKAEPEQASANPVDPGYTSHDERFEEGPRKRAKVMQAEWSGRTDFGKQPESLRVAASTAASVRMHQPTAIRPNNSLATDLENPPREPTPVANGPSRFQRPSFPPPRSSLRRESFAAEHKPYASPYAPPDGSIHPGESALTSPEASQDNSSPVDMASSPPVYRGTSTAPPSPRLPPLLKDFHDSGFMSGSIDDLFGDDEMRPIDDEDLMVASQYKKRPDLQNIDSEQGVEPQLPQTDRPDRQGGLENPFDAKAAAQKKQMAANARLLNRTASSGNLTPATMPASDPVRPTALHRSQTWSGNQPSHPMSEFTSTQPTIETVQRPASRGRKGSESGSGAGAKRKQAIQSKLASSVAAGEMPPFCDNCGAIETPTWRKAWVKIHSGTPEHVVISEDDGGIIAWQPLQMDQNGVVSLYRIIKKSLLKGDEGFTEVLLCNPCGLWLHSRKCMRPKEVWEKPADGGGGKRKRPINSRRQGDRHGSNPPAGSNSHGAGMYSDASSPAEEGGQTDTLENEPRLPVAKHRRASSDQLVSPQKRTRNLNDVSAMAALQRAIKSSPHKFAGSEHIPIEIGDLTPQPTRRILFPSPSHSKEAASRHKSSDSNRQQEVTRSIGSGEFGNTSYQADKENCPPVDDATNQSLFDEDPFLNTRSLTPTPTSSKHTMLFKTPIKSPKRLPTSTGDFFSSAAKALLNPPSTPQWTPTKHGQPLTEMTPFTAHLNQLLSETNNGSPGSQSFGFPALPSLRNTPNRSTQNVGLDFSHFDSQDLVSTDVPMPSSPPVWFGVFEDSDEHGPGSLWGDCQVHDDASKAEAEKENAGLSTDFGEEV